MPVWSFIDEQRETIRWGDDRAKLIKARDELVKKIAGILRGKKDQEVRVIYIGGMHTGKVEEVHQEKGDPPVSAYVTFSPPVPKGKVYLLEILEISQEDED